MVASVGIRGGKSSGLGRFGSGNGVARVVVLDELADFFIESHLTEKFFDTGFDFRIGKLCIGGLGGLRCGMGSKSKRSQAEQDTGEEGART
jgi:hypothetical protein